VPDNAVMTANGAPMIPPEARAVSDEQLASVLLEDDIRDALQCVSVRRPSPSERCRLVGLCDEVGIGLTFAGFPAVSGREFQDCLAVLNHIRSSRLKIRPVVMARAVESDLLRVLDLRHATGTDILVDLYICTSPIRAVVEGWSVADLLERLRASCRRARAEGLPFRIALEDSTRTPRADLVAALRRLADLEPECVVLNDTAGHCLPAAAAAETAAVKDLLTTLDSPATVAWHGHNDKGLALANALAAVGAGADVVSGTVLGVGERSGNIPLEQMLLLASQAGATRYRLDAVPQLCAEFARATGIEIRPGAPLVGADVFSTGTGTHAAALLKARMLGRNWEDLVYSGVPAADLGFTHTILIGPNSGTAAVRQVLSDAGLPVDENTVNAVLEHCHTQSTCIRDLTQLRSVITA
jgi:isopropylmalate/homocitrate/citramalate synthase